MIRGLNDKNFRLKIPELHASISLAECKFNIKSSSISITLKKEKNENWTDIKPKASLLGDKKEKPGPKKEEEGDGMGGIMNMMKEMYNNGDDNMKKMIAESWQKS